MSGRFEVLLASSVHWHFTWQRHHEIAAGLAERGHGVTYLEPFPKRWPGLSEIGRVVGRLRGRHEEAGLFRQRVPDGVRLRAVTALPDTGPLSRALNRRFVAPRAARGLGAELGRPLVLIHYLPLAISVALQRLLAPDLAIYDCVWDWPNDPYSRRGVVREEEMLGAADLVFADAPYLYERMRSAHGHVERVLPAVDYELYAPAREPAGERGSSPRCAYFGAVGANVDRALLARLSHEFPLRIVGPVQEELTGLASGTEVLGPVPQRELPALLREADVLVLPYREAAHSRGVIPAKTFECLATGKPTVATGLPSLTEMGELFHLAEGGDGFLDAVRRAFDEPPEARERRLTAARENSWSRRVDEIEGHIGRRLARS